MKNSLSSQIRSCFLIDGVGGVLTALSLGLVFASNPHWMGLTKSSLFTLGSIGFMCALFSLSCFLLKVSKPAFLTFILRVNIIYCIGTLLFLLWSFSKLTVFAYVYFSIELGVIFFLVEFESHLRSRAIDPQNLGSHAAFARHIHLAEENLGLQEFDLAMDHLRVAHVFGQKQTYEHVRSHVLMLRTALASGHSSELCGQMKRIIAAYFFSRIWVPSGNTGGSDVPALKAMTFPDQLLKLLNDSEKNILKI